MTDSISSKTGMAAGLPILAILLALSPVDAQEAPQSTPEAVPPVSLRTWIFPSGGKEEITLSMVTQPDTPPVPLAKSQSGERVAESGYRDLAAGTINFLLTSGDKPLASSSLPLTAGRQYTMVAWEAGGRWQIKPFVDGPFPRTVADRPVRVLNFAQGRTTILSIGTGPETSIPPDTIQEFRSPPKTLGVSVKVLAPDGGPAAESSGDIDLVTASSSYVVIGPDYRGRMRPQLVQGGIRPNEPVAVVEQAPVVPVSAEVARKSSARMQLEHELGQVLILMNQPGEQGNRAKLEAQKADIEQKLQKLR